MRPAELLPASPLPDGQRLLLQGNFKELLSSYVLAQEGLLLRSSSLYLVLAGKRCKMQSHTQRLL